MSDFNGCYRPNHRHHPFAATGGCAPGSTVADGGIRLQTGERIDCLIPGGYQCRPGIYLGSDGERGFDSGTYGNGTVLWRAESQADATTFRPRKRPSCDTMHADCRLSQTEIPRMDGRYQPRADCEHGVFETDDCHHGRIQDELLQSLYRACFQTGRLL